MMESLNKSQVSKPAVNPLSQQTVHFNISCEVTPSPDEQVLQHGEETAAEQKGDTVMKEECDSSLSKLKNLFEGILVDKCGTECKGSDVLCNKIIGIFFSASWSPPCKDFVSLLVNFHTELCQRGAPFEIVFVSCDSSEQDMMSYFKEMHGDWWAVPYGHILNL